MDLSWSELMVVAIVALVVIGPKDLPGMFRELGRFTAKVRAMGREFTRAMDAAAKESGVKDVADDLKKVTSPKAMGLDAVRSAADKFEKWDPLKSTTPKAAPLVPPPMPATPVAAAAAAGPATAALSAKVAGKKADAAKVTEGLRAKKAAKAEPVTKSTATATETAPAPVVTAEAPTQKRGGRVRKKADPAPADAAKGDAA